MVAPFALERERPVPVDFFAVVFLAVVFRVAGFFFAVVFVVREEVLAAVPLVDSFSVLAEELAGLAAVFLAEVVVLPERLVPEDLADVFRVPVLALTLWAADVLPAELLPAELLPAELLPAELLPALLVAACCWPDLLGFASSSATVIFVRDVERVVTGILSPRQKPLKGTGQPGAVKSRGPL